MLDLQSPAFYNKIFGCWMGKNCGGTLGAPLEKCYGEPEPFDVWWYPKLQEGGIPNDDLEMQLVWLKAIEEVGPALSARNMAEYWLNHIGYNFDEYGLSRMSLRLGLMPPVSGRYNNWFVDCMGCPIRSEIFACVAPGLPRLAVRYAYEDAICDHAGGESVYGEMFNCSMESAAFIVSDLNELLDIGRSYVADDSKTAAAIDAARAAHKAGLDWRGARQKVLEAAPHYIAQYSPINMGFQAIGLLYGKDFAEAICIAVNCGYDTDCTGATVGALLGIVLGNSGLPRKWTEPLGTNIATNESWGGLRNCRVGHNPIPNDLDDLTRRTIAQAIRFSAGHTPSCENCHADESIRALWRKSVSRVMVPVGTFNVGVDYKDHPVAIPGSTKSLQTVITNTAAATLNANCSLNVPEGWRPVTPQSVQVPSYGEVTINWQVPIPPSNKLANSNHLSLRIESPERVAQSDAPVVLVGARRVRVSKPYALPANAADSLLDHPFEPEIILGGNLLLPGARQGLDTVHHALGHDLGLAKMLPADHAIYVQAFVYSDTERAAVLGLPTTGGVKSWVNGQLTHNLAKVEGFRPHFHKTQPYLDMNLRPGFNEILIKFVRPAAATEFEGYMIFSDPADVSAGIVDVGWTQLPWD